MKTRTLSLALAFGIFVTGAFGQTSENAGLQNELCVNLVSLWDFNSFFPLKSHMGLYLAFNFASILPESFF